MNSSFLRQHPYYSFFFVVSVGFLVFQTWISGWYGLLDMVFMTGVFSVCMSWIFFFIRMLLGRKPAIDKNYIWKIALWILSFQGAIHLILFGFTYYQNDIAPASLGRIEISDGQKTVVFQQMSHIATESFYKKIHQDIEKYTSSGFVVYFEGVGSGSKESSEILDTAIGIKLHSGTYSSIAEIIGMREQNYNTLFSGLKDTSSLKNVDISLDEVANLYTARTHTGSRRSTPPVDIEGEISKAVNTMSPQEQMVMRYFMRALMNYLLKNNEDLFVGGLSSIIGNDIMTVILEERNKHIAQYILSSDNPKIYALYGALHFEGVFQELQKSNPAWKILSVREYRPYQ